MGTQAVAGAASPDAISPYIYYSQAVLTEAKNLQTLVKERYGKQDETNAWKLLGADYKVSVTLPEKYLKATYYYNSQPIFRETSDRYHHIFFTQVVKSSSSVPIFTAETETFNKLKAILSKPPVSNMSMTCQYTSRSPANPDIVAVLAVPYQPLPGSTQITPEALSQLITNFLQYSDEMHRNINDILQANKTYKPLPVSPQHQPPSQKTVLPNTSKLINDNFKEFARFATERLQDFRELEKQLYKEGHKKFLPRFRVIVTSTSTLGSEAIPYSPEFLVSGKSSKVFKLVFGTAFPAPNFFMDFPQGQIYNTLMWYVENVKQQLLPKDGLKLFKYSPSLTSAKQLSLVYTTCQVVKLTERSQLEVADALKLFREAVYGISGINLL